MSIIAATTKKQKEEITEAANALNINLSAFIKLAVTEKIVNMRLVGILPKKGELK